MGTQRRYRDFDLVIDPAVDGSFRVRVAESPAGEASAPFELPFSDLELENFLLKVGRPRRGTRRLESPEMEAARTFGGRLFDAVFTEDIRLCLRRSLDEAERSGDGLRIRLRLNDAPALANVPWEYLYNRSVDRFLVLSSWTPIVRYPDLPQRIPTLSIEPPLRILAVISSPTDHESLDVDGEAERIRASLADLETSGLVTVDTLEDATLLALQRQLRRADYHVLHFIGHGGFDKAADDGVLMFEDENGKSRIVSGRDLGTILADQRTLRLAVLNACDGARASAEDPFAGSAQSLIRQGLPAVVAMQFEITDGAAIAFAHEFYAAIADGSPVDMAVAEGRRAIFGQGNDIEWGTPVLYMRSPNGILFDIAAAPSAPAASAPPDPAPPAPEETPSHPEETAPAAGDAVTSAAVEPDTLAEADAPVEPDVPTPEPSDDDEPAPAAQSDDRPPDENDAGQAGDQATVARGAAGTTTAPPDSDTPDPGTPDPEGLAPAPPTTTAPPRETTSQTVADHATSPTGTQPATKPTPWGKIGAGVAGVVLVAGIGIGLAGGGTTETTTSSVTTSSVTTSSVTTSSVPPVTTHVLLEPGTAVAARASSPPVIDGDDGDWEVSRVHVTPEVVFRNQLIQNGTLARLGSNAAAEIRLAWDTTNLYVFAVVEDDILSAPESGNQIWRGDAVTLNIAVGDRGPSASVDPDANDFQVTLSPGDPRAGTTVGSVIFNGVNGRFGNDRTGIAEVAAQFPGNGVWHLEAAIPWSELGVANPGDIGPSGILVALFDNDGEREQDGSRSLQALILGNTLDAVFQGPSTWGSLTLEP